jgi:predicted Ser/Thr protein kinase
MPSSLTCPEEAELLALAMGDPVPAEVTAHLAGCASCQTRLEQFKAEVALLRADPQAGSFSPSPSISPPPSTVSEAMSHPDATNGQVEHADATAPWESPDLAGDGSSASRTGLGDHEGSASSEAPFPAAIGKYLVVGRFPHSGQAEVFRVVHPQFQQERVLKLAKAPVGPDGRSEIVEEGKIMAELEHPHLIRVYDLDFLNDRPYLVMEYIRGRNLEHYAAEKPLCSREAAALVAKVAGAAGFAHRRGIVHRDIKPRNILVDERGEPRLIDFGMARLRTAWSDDRKEPDGGTFAFMAPEQARIDSPEDRQKAGPRSDVFALGATLYFLLTGQAPFSGQTWREAWDRARRCDFDAGALNDRTIPAPLRRICLKAMAADPAARFASAEAFQKALDRYVQSPRVRAAIASVAGLALLGVLVYQVVPRGTMAPPPAPVIPYVILPAPGPPPILVAPQPMKGRIDLLVVKSKDGTRRRLRLEDRGSVPVRADDEIRIEARLDCPAYLYLFWLGSEGKIAPLYPWKDHDWSTRPVDERKVTGAELPEIADDVWTMPASPSGLEILVLLAREDSPLPREDESKLAQALAGLPVALPAGMSEAIWLEDGQEVVSGPAQGSKRGERGEEDLSRGIPSPKARKSDDPVLRIRGILSNKLQPLGSYSQAVLFPNVGG